MGFGSNIQNARLANAAVQALQHGDRVQGLDYARRAAQAAPGNPQLWFLVGYAARLNGRYEESVESYSRGLRLTPGSLEGSSGLAQTFIAAGAAQVVASLWDVDDEGSLPVMQAFYKHLKEGMLPSLALHQAKLDSLGSDPRFWGIYGLIQ